MEAVSDGQVNPDIIKTMEKANITFTKTNQSISDICKNIGATCSFSPTSIFGKMHIPAGHLMQNEKITASFKLVLRTNLGCPGEMSVSL